MRSHIGGPRSLAAIATTPTSVHITWVAPVTLITGYYLTSEPLAVEKTLDASALAVDVTGLSVGSTYVFSLQTVGEDRLSLPVSVSVNTPLPTSNVIASVPQYYQLPLSCEETVTSMVLVNQGLNISTQQVLDALGVDNTPMLPGATNPTPRP